MSLSPGHERAPAGRKLILFLLRVAQTSAIDCSNFDTEFTSEAPQDSVVEGSNLSQSVQGGSGLLAQITYNGPIPLTHILYLRRAIRRLYVHSWPGAPLGKRPEQRNDVIALCPAPPPPFFVCVLSAIFALHSVSMCVISALSAALIQQEAECQLSN